MSDLRSSNIYDMLDEDGVVSAPVPAKKDAKSTTAEKPSKKQQDAPPKKERVAKSEEPAAPVGKEQRGSAGRESKPRGRGRDNKGGLRRPAGTGREFDRRSGPSATHRNPREGKRSDRGSHNWGNETEEGTLAATTTEEPTPTSPPPPTEENKTDAATAETKDAEKKDEPKEEEDKTVTFDQFLKRKEAKAPEHDKLEARAVENDDAQWKVVKEVVSEKKKGKTQDDKDDDKEKAAKGKKKNIVTWDEFVAAGPPRPAREERPRAATTGGTGGGETRGRGRGRGGGSRGAGRGGSSRGGGGGRGHPRGHAPELSEDAFPKLGAGK